MKETLYFPEIFELVGEAKTKEEKIKVLHRFYNEKGFLDLLCYCYEPKIEWLVTREDIEHLKYDHMDIADYDLAPETLFNEAKRRLQNFTNLRKPPLKKSKVIKLITNMFSVLHHKEIELFKQIVDRNILDIGMDEGLVREAFPQLLTGEYPPRRKAGRPIGAKGKNAKPKVPSTRKAGRPPGAKNKKKAPVKKKPVKKKAAPRKKIPVVKTPIPKKVVAKTVEVG